MHILILNDLFLFLRVKWVTFYGTKYQPGMIVAEGHDGLMPIFAQVKFLLALPDKRVFSSARECKFSDLCIIYGHLKWLS